MHTEKASREMLLSTNEPSTILKISPVTVRKWIRNDYLKSHRITTMKIGRIWYVDKQDFIDVSFN